MLQEKTIKDMTKDQKEKMYLYFHQKIFNKDSQTEMAKRREIIDDSYYHDVIMEMLNLLLENFDDTEMEEESESDEIPKQKLNIVYDRNN